MKSFNIYMCGSKQQSRFEGEGSLFQTYTKTVKKIQNGQFETDNTK